MSNQKQPLMVTLQDVRKDHLCNRGTRMWFAARGLDFNAFRKVGIDAGTLLATGDLHALRAVTQAEVRTGRKFEVTDG